MDAIVATLAAYRDAAIKTARTITRSWMAALALGVASGTLGVIAVVTASLGIVGGFILGLAQAACAGAYLYLLEAPVKHQRRVGMDDIRSSPGRYVWDVISVLFIFWIGSMLLTPFSGTFVMIGVFLVVYVVFNPAQELIYLGYSRSLALLGDAGRFMFDNWIEWLLPHLLIGALLFVVAPDLGIFHLQMFGPFFGFTSVNNSFFTSLMAGSFSPFSLGRALLLLGMVHLTMLFRGFLYLELSQGSRRARAWRQKFR